MSNSDGDVEIVETQSIPRKRKSKKTTSCEKRFKSDYTDEAIFDTLKMYFERDESGKIKCNVVDCKSAISRWGKYYMNRHFESKHPTLLSELFPSMLCVDKQCQLDMFELSNSAVELVTINGFPFSILDSSGIKGLLKKQFDDLAENGYKLTINRHIIAEKIDVICTAIKDQISKEFKGKLISIMFDICKKKTFAVLGVCAITMRDGIVIARSLGMIHLTERHKGPYLADVIETLLKEYSISLKQVSTATTDKAANMNNTVRHLVVNANAGDGLSNREHDDIDENERDSGECPLIASDDDDDDMELADENFIELENELNNDGRFIEIIKGLTEELYRRNNFLSLIHQVDCCAHKTQLAVNSAIQKSNAISIIEEVREMTRLLRTTVINIKFRKLAPTCVLPPQHVDVRWNADFLMVCHFWFIQYVPLIGTGFL